MAASERNSETTRSAGLGDIHHPLASRLLATFGSFDLRELLVVALLIGGLPFVVCGAIAVRAGFVLEYLSTASVYLWTAGLFGGGLTFGWWAKRYPELWVRLAPVFAVSDEEYRAVVQPRITQMYNLGRAVLWFPVLLVLGVVYDLTVGVRFLVYIPEAAFIWLGPINYLYGIVSLLGLVIATHVAFNHLRLVSEIMDLRLQDIHTAAIELRPLARFNIVIAAGWFVSLTLGIVLLRINPLYVVDSLQSLLYSGEFPLVSIMFLFLVVFGFVLIAVPQYSIHARLETEKQTLLDEMDAEYEELYAAVSTTDGDGDSLDQLSVRLDVLEARRRNTKQLQTWAYDLPGVVSLIATSVVPIISLFL